MPHQLRHPETFSSNHALLKSLPVGFMTSLKELDNHMFMFDSAVGCVYVMPMLNRSALVGNAHNGTNTTVALQVFPFERMFDCSNVVNAEVLAKIDYTAAEHRCAALWEKLKTSVEGDQVNEKFYILLIKFVIV